MQINWFYWVPKKGISRLVGLLANSKCKHLGKILIFMYRKLFNVDLQDALYESPADYVSLNDFFTRKLKDSARPIDPNPSVIVSPCDGMFGQVGEISGATLLQAKNQFYTVGSLLSGIGEGEFEPESAFVNGKYITIYLSPRDYHRVHMPLAGTLQHMMHVPGNLFPVYPKAVQVIDQLYVRNERVLFWFETDFGPMVIAMIGALNVGSITVQGYGRISSVEKTATQWDVTDSMDFNKGSELAYFNMGGSCVVALFPQQHNKWNSQVVAGSSVCMGYGLN